MPNSDLFRTILESEAYCEGRAAAKAGAITTPADATTGSIAANNGLTWSSGVAGAGGQVITLVDPGANSANLAIAITENSATVQLATDGSGVITSIANDVVTAWPANQPIQVQTTVGSLGTGLLEADTATIGKGGNPFPNGSRAAMAFAAGAASWSASPSGQRDECALPHGGGFGG